MVFSMAYPLRAGFRVMNAEIFIINRDGTGLTHLTQNDIYDGTPDWVGGS